jgi:hypothetical protein
LLQMTFKEVFFIFSPHLNYSLIKDLKPDILLIQYLERFLPWIPNDFSINSFDHAAFKSIINSSGELFPKYAPLSDRYNLAPHKYINSRLYSFFPFQSKNEILEIEDLLNIFLNKNPDHNFKTINAPNFRHINEFNNLC